MNTDQIVTAVFLLLGIVSGVFSFYSNVVLAFVVSFAIYFGVSFATIKFVKSKKRKLILANSAVTFFSVWLIVWIFLFTNYQI